MNKYLNDRRSMIDELSLVLKLIRKSNDNETQKIIEKISFIFKQNA